MLPKPRGCVGCPMYGDGVGWVPDELIPEAAVLIVGQSPGLDEEIAGKPFVGRTGHVMETEYFPRAGLIRGENVSLCNTLRCRWLKRGQRTNELPPSEILTKAIVHCTREHFKIPPGTKLIVAQGALAWKTMGGAGKIMEWRGYLKP